MIFFYELDKLRSGNEVILKERRGQVYRYRVNESLTTGLNESWIMGQVRGRDMLSLQTCTPITAFEMLLVVRADRFSGSYALQ